MFGVSYASCGPTIVGGGWQGSGQGDVVSPLHVGSVPSCHASSFIQLIQQQQAIQEKRIISGVSQYIQTMEGTQFPKD